MPKSKFVLNNTQLAVSIISMLLGVGVLTLPRAVTGDTGTATSWVSIILSGILITIVAIFLVKLSAAFPGKTFVQYTPIIMGKYVGWVFGVIFIIYFIFFVALEIRMLALVIQQYLLVNTPQEMVMLLLLFASTYLVLGGLGPVIRVNQLFLPIILLILAFNIGTSLSVFEVTNVRPIFSKEVINSYKGIPESLLSFLGIEIILVFLAFMARPEKAVSATVIGIGITAFIYVDIVFMAMGIFGKDAVVTLVWPTMEMVKSIEMPGGFVERVESVFLTVWVMTIFNTTAMSHYIASLSLSQLFNSTFKPFVFVVPPISFLIAIYPQGIIEMLSFGDILSYIGLTVIMGGSVVMLIIAKLRRLGRYAKK